MMERDIFIEKKISEKLIDYEEAMIFMKNRVKSIIEKKEKELVWFLSHNHIYTCGTSFKNNEIINKTNIPIIKTNRGGKITYHGPGQRIVYLMINLNQRKRDLRKYISVIENSVISLLKNFKIEARSFPDRVGIWVTKINNTELSQEKKIGAIGLRIKKWITYHGLSFNINPNLSYYKNIKPCGLENYSSTSLKELGIELDTQEFDQMFMNIFIEKLKTY